ncbi:MAG: 6,7-dimethyl-8-ribityllumazine synthase [Bacteroidetes bacterium]|nr:6,7-dimethyl-8-ribityllumazine synthase [Bacteroidota bacterium]
MAFRTEPATPKTVVLKKASAVKIGIVVSQWHSDITHELLSGALLYLKAKRILLKNIIVDYVPGSFELPLGAQWQLERGVDASICLGCVIKGETMHFEFICHALASGIKDLNLKFSKPVIFGVLTPNTLKQAQQRAGGKFGNKGHEAAEAALQMLILQGK